MNERTAAMLKAFRAWESHEDIFVNRYAQLLAWARQIAQGDRGAAEDLVHDAYVNFTVSRPDLAGIRNLDGYLFTTLRNLHLANVRRGAQRGHTQVPIIDYDSAADALRALAPTRAHDELAAICQYACLRRLSSKAASVLILRFFHAYRPSEIARVLRVSTNAVDNWLKLARREARIWVQDPERLRFLQRADRSLPRAIGFVEPANLLRDLQTVIFEASQTACRADADLAALYAAPERPLDCPTLAHIVACRRCLDAINDRLGLPRLAERELDEAMEQGTRPPRDPEGGRGSQGGDDGAAGARPATRAGGGRGGRPRAERPASSRPSELRIAANGQVIGGQQVTDARVSLHVLVQSPERLGFVEVLDEDEARLVLVNVEAPPDGAVEQVTRVALSDARELTVCVSFAGAWPSVTLTYEDGDALREASALVLAGDAADAVALARADSRIALPSWLSASRASRIRAWLLGWLHLPRPVLVALAVLTFVAVMGGPGQAFSAVVHAGRTVVEFVAHIIGGSRTSRADGDAGDDDARRSPSHRTDIELPALRSAAATSAASTMHVAGLSEGARLALEVDILQRLDGVDALYGEALTLTQCAPGFLRLDGIVAQAERRREVIAALGALVSIPQLDVRVRSAADAPSRAAAAAASAPSVRAVEVTRDRSAVSEALAQALRERGLASGRPAATEEAARAVATRVLESSRRVVLQAWAFKRIAAQVSGDQLRRANPDAYRAWIALLTRHAAAFVQEAAQLEAELDASGLLHDISTDVALARDGASPSASTTPADDMSRAAEQLVALADPQDQQIRTLFAVAPDGAPVDVDDGLRAVAARLRASHAFAQALLLRLRSLIP